MTELQPPDQRGETTHQPAGPTAPQRVQVMGAGVGYAFTTYVTSSIRSLGQFGTMMMRTVGSILERPLEVRSTIYQFESIGVKSLGIATMTAIFVGMVMAVQFAVGLQRFGGMEYTGRIVAVSFTRELAPTLTAIIVGGRISSGIAAEVGSMAVTEQIDAIRSLGADPIKKLVVPRFIAAVCVMPLLSAFALVLGFLGAMFISSVEFGIPAQFFLRTGLSAVDYDDYWSGLMKTPVFGGIIALIGCHFGLQTTGGTEGVGRATTQSVVATSISILVADFILTKFAIIIFPGL